MKVHKTISIDYKLALLLEREKINVSALFNSYLTAYFRDQLNQEVKE